ncbi:hypothetical protein GC207_14995 [bacterium]|nr:hypothetical protein [bacterium]
MKQRYRMYRRQGGVFYATDRQTGIRTSLKTSDPETARRLLQARNEAQHQPIINRQIARAYLAVGDEEICRRTWGVVMAEIIKTKQGETQHRWRTAAKDKAFDLIRDLPLFETNAQHFLKVLEKGKVSTNIYLRRIHNFALDIGWLPWPVLPKRKWPAFQFKPKRAITIEEHRAIVATTFSCDSVSPRGLPPKHCRPEVPRVDEADKRSLSNLHENKERAASLFYAIGGTIQSRRNRRGR